MKQAFLSYARIDTAYARRLLRDLRADGSIKIWFDRDDLVGGMKWRPAIRKAIRDSRFFIALLSRRAVSRRGYRHTELRQALRVMSEFPEDRIFLTPGTADTVARDRYTLKVTSALGSGRAISDAVEGLRGADEDLPVRYRR